jgi:formate dehydrogenase subunit gamma
MLTTGAVLYVPSFSVLVGRREVVRTIHVYTGLLLPFPVLVGVVGRRWGRGLRADLRRINRWTADDWEWLRSWGRAARERLGKFNPGQKLNAAFTGGAILVMLATGSIMRWYKPWPLRWRTGATFVHDWIAIALFVTITGHIMKALSDSGALSGMLTGKVSRAWARLHAPRWAEEMSRAEGADAPAGRS